MGCDYRSNQTEIHELKKKNAELQEKLDGISMQEKCAKMAEHSFETLPKGRNEIIDYTCHYNKKQNKFYMSITSLNTKTLSTSKMIVDLLENKTFASYMWQADKVKKYWEVKPFYVEVNGEKKDWTTEDWDAYEKVCMNN
jgi:predicted  nucleic acid-binding Zn-ribbon protein